MLIFISSTIVGLSAETCDLTYPQGRESQGVKSQDLGGEPFISLARYANYLWSHMLALLLALLLPNIDSLKKNQQNK